MRIIVTGGAGFIGSAVCRHLIEETNAYVVNVDKISLCRKSRVTPNCEREFSLSIREGGYLVVVPTAQKKSMRARELAWSK